MMGSIVRWMDRQLYPRYSDNWDNSFFRDTILGELSDDAVVLDLGAGAGIVEQTRFRGQAKHISGVDLDRRVLENPYLDEAKVGDGERLPFDDASFDVVFCNNVLEHLEHPDQVFSEVVRVLKPGGVFLAKTPNRTHYVPLIASCTPHWFHQMVNKMRGRSVEDTFPTCYLANSPRDVSRHANEAGLKVRSIELFEGRPEYLRMTPITYLAGWLYERLVNATSRLQGYRAVMISVLEKPRVEEWSQQQSKAA